MEGNGSILQVQHGVPLLPCSVARVAPRVGPLYIKNKNPLLTTNSEWKLVETAYPCCCRLFCSQRPGFFATSIERVPQHPRYFELQKEMASSVYSIQKFLMLIYMQQPKKKHRAALVRCTRTSIILVKMNQNAQLLLPLLGLVLVPSGASGLEVAMNDPSILYSPFTWLVTEVKYFTISFFLFFLSGSIGRNFANNLPNSLIFGWKQD